ncbi:MAG: hypothetical protein ACLFUH_03290 [Bacteroidales bacterium]
MKEKQKDDKFSFGDRVKVFGKYKGTVIDLFHTSNKPFCLTGNKSYAIHFTPPITKDEIELIVVEEDELELIYDDLGSGDKLVHQGLVWCVKDKHVNQNGDVVYFAVNNDNRASIISASSIEEIVTN